MDLNKFEAELKMFDPLEIDCRNFYFSENGFQLTYPLSADVIKQRLQILAKSYKELVREFPTEVHDDFFREDDYLPHGCDVALIKHPRYLPTRIHSHAFIEIIYILNGHCTQFANNIPAEMSRGDLCIVAPSVEHTISVFDDDSIVVNILIRRSTFDTAFFNLMTEKDILSKFFARILYDIKPSPYILFKTVNDDEIEQLVMKMFMEFKYPREHSNRLLKIYLMLLCIYLLRNHGDDVTIINPLDNLQNETIVQILRYIQNNFKSVSLFDVAREFSYSEAHLSRVIKGLTGRTFSGIVREIKVHKAAEMLSNPEISINEIVEYVGYTDISHFYKNFKQYYGSTPIRYRELISTK